MSRLICVLLAMVIYCSLNGCAGTAPGPNSDSTDQSSHATEQGSGGKEGSKPVNQPSGSGSR